MELCNENVKLIEFNFNARKLFKTLLLGYTTVLLDLIGNVASVHEPINRLLDWEL